MEVSQDTLPAKKLRAKRMNAPKHAVVVRAFKFPIESTRAQSIKLFGHCDLCCEVRNILVRDRETNRLTIRAQKAAQQESDSYLTRADQYTRIAGLVKQDRRLTSVHSQVLQNVAERIDKGHKAWLSHLAQGNPGRKSPPGPVESHDYRSFCFPQYGSAAHVKSGRLHLSKLGDFALRDYRKLKGKPKSITVTFEDGRWWAVISCEVREQDVFRSAAEVADLPDIGADPGLESLLVLADGTAFNPPKALKDNLAKLRRAQRDMSRKFEARKTAYEAEAIRRNEAGEPKQCPLREIPYSNRLKAQIRVVAKLHTAVKNVRGHHHKKIARQLEKTVRCLAFEEHGVQFMIRNRRLARSACDRGIAAFKGALQSAMGPRYLPTANRRQGVGGNSQTCLCDAPVPKTLKDREHDCPACGLKAPRDVVSANIVMSIAFGRNLLDQSAGHADRRGEIEAQKLARASQGTLEISVKRKPVLPKGCATANGEPTAGAKTASVLRRKIAALPAEANTRQPTRPPGAVASGQDCHGN